MSTGICLWTLNSSDHWCHTVLLSNCADQDVLSLAQTLMYQGNSQDIYIHMSHQHPRVYNPRHMRAKTLGNLLSDVETTEHRQTSRPPPTCVAIQILISFDLQLFTGIWDCDLMT